MKCPFVIKICPKCKRILVASEINFYKDKSKKYRVSSYCRNCYYDNWKENYDKDKEINLKRKKEYYQKNKEEILKYHKEYNEKNRKEISRKGKEYYRKNKERILKRDKDYYNSHKEERREYAKQYRKNNPEKEFNNRIKRRIKEGNQGRGITKEQWLEMMEFFGWKCAYSGITLSKEIRSIDHIISLSEGGEHEIWNCIPMYMPYNSSKKNKDMVTWYKQQDFFDIDRLMKIYEWQEYAFEKWGNK